MKIKTYNIEIDFFSCSEWKNVSIEIISISKIQLIRAFLNETYTINDIYSFKPKSIKELQKELWHKTKIHEEFLEFPIIKYH